MEQTQLGKATFFSSLSPSTALSAMQALNEAQSGIILTSDLHIVYLLTPPFPAVEPDWQGFISIYSQLSRCVSSY